MSEILNELTLLVRKLNDKRVRCLLLPHYVKDNLKTEGCWKKTIITVNEKEGVLYYWFPSKLTITLPESFSNLQRISFEPKTEASPFIIKMEGFFGVAQNIEINPFSKLNEFQQNETKTNVDEIRQQKQLYLALMSAYFSEKELIEFCKENYNNFLACLSNFVFEAEIEEAAEENLEFEINESDLPADIDINTIIKPQPDEVKDVKSLTIKLSQLASGNYFVIPDLNEGSDFWKSLKSDFDKGIDDKSNYRIRLSRSIGNDPTQSMTTIGEFPIQTFFEENAVPAELKEFANHSKYQAIDSMKATDFAGWQINYKLEVLNEFNQTFAWGAVTVLRERLDPPPTPTFGNAKLLIEQLRDEINESNFKYDLKIILSGTLEDLINENAAELSLEIYAQERPLDECGFYGDDDDMGLLEGLIESDIDYEPRINDEADRLKPLFSDPVEFERTRGKFDRNGLVNIANVELTDEVFNSAHRKFEFEINIKDNDLLRKGIGYRFFIGLKRTPKFSSNSFNLPASYLCECTHTLELKRYTAADKQEAIDKSRKCFSIFQLELFDLTSAPNKRFLNYDGENKKKAFEVILSDEESRKGVTINQIFVNFHHPSISQEKGSASFVQLLTVSENETEDKILIGGYKILYRDIIGENDLSPFTYVESLQVLPLMVAQYQPVQLEDGTDWEIISKNYSNSFSAGAIEINLDEATLKERQEKCIEVANQLTCLLTGKEYDPLKIEEYKEVFRIRGDYLFKRDEEDAAKNKTIDTETIENQKNFIKQVVDLANDDLSWKKLGRIVTLLREDSLTIDFLIKQKFLIGIEKLIEDISGTDKLPSNIKLIFAKTNDRYQMATMRIVIVPQNPTWLSGEVDGSKIKNLYQTFIEGSPVIVLKDNSREPLYMTIPPDRQINYEWKGLNDKWHHDLEFIIECLDRYQKIRNFFYSDIQTASKSEVPEGVKAKISVPRTEPFNDSILVYPVQNSNQQSIAFRITESMERDYSSKNAVARARYGKIQLHLSPYRRFEKIDEYRTFLNTINTSDDEWIPTLNARDGWQKIEKDDQKEFGILWCEPEGIEKAKAGETETDSQTFATDYVNYQDMPFYYTYGLTAWHSADLSVSDETASAEQVRLPSRLGILGVPSIDITVSVDGESKRIDISLDFVLSRLGSHLTPEELAQASIIDFNLKLNEERLLSLRELPDFELEYHFFRNLSENEKYLKLSPLFAINFDLKDSKSNLEVFDQSLIKSDEPSLAWTGNFVGMNCKVHTNDQTFDSKKQWYLLLKRGKLSSKLLSCIVNSIK